MSYLTHGLERRRNRPDPPLPMADALRTLGQYTLAEAAFEPIPDSHPLIRRHHQVEKFRTERRPPMRPRFNKSTKDELHPFPERALTSTNACYNGVEVAVTHFPAVVQKSGFLRFPTLQKRPVWTENRANARRSHRYTFQCPALEEKEPPMSYLAEKIVEDCSETKKTLERGWCGNTELVSEYGHEPDYLEVNKRTNRRYLRKKYVNPLENARRVNEERKKNKRLQREAEGVMPMTLHHREDAPKVFKMSNIDEWWKLDPVRVGSEQTSLKDTINSNPYHKDPRELR